MNDTAAGTVTLNNGVEMPRIGYGVYQIPSSITERCVRDALSVGYRSIDTAQCYGNERAVGKAIKASGIPREEIFVTTKLWGGRGYRDTVGSIDDSLKALGLDTIDLLLIHEPTGDFHEIYRAMEDAYKAGKLRAIGVANFLEKNYRSLLETASIVPAERHEEAAGRSRNDPRILVASRLRTKRLLPQSCPYGDRQPAWKEQRTGRSSFPVPAGHCDHSEDHAYRADAGEPGYPGL